MAGIAPADAAAAPPVVGIVCCLHRDGEHVRHAVSEKYILAAIDGAGALPFLIPAMGDRISPASVIARIDGLLVSGAPSNVEPQRYGGAPSRPGTLHDPARDGMTLPLLQAAVAADLPVLAICRGIQELNVALGGTLHQLVHELPGQLDHRAPQGPVELRYAHAAHEVAFAEGGLCASLFAGHGLVVNSLHSQGIDRLAPGLVAEALAPDGQIEAVSLPAARFVVGIQWHPEHRLLEQPFSCALFAAFAAACRTHARARDGAAAR